MNRRQRIIVSVTGIFIVLLILIGLTYAYFLTRITGNSNPTSISVTTANLELVYGDGTTALLTSNTPIEPGKFSSSKDFTVTNNGTVITDYAVTLEDFSVTYANDTVIDGESVASGTVTKMEYPSDMKMEITCTIESKDDTRNGTSCGIKKGTLPTHNDILYTNSVKAEETHKYVLTLTYEDSGIDQSLDMNKMIKGKIDIIDLKSTIDLSGTVASYQTGDYVEINSTPIRSEIVDGTYKIIGVEPGNHTLNVKYKDTNGDIKTRGTANLIIQKGTEETVSENVITFTDISREATIDLNSNYTLNISEQIKEYKDFYDNIKKGIVHSQYLNLPENTIHTYEAAVDTGFKYVETDIIFTSDNIPVLSHDDTINRVARNNDGSELSETITIPNVTYSELLNYDFGIYKKEIYAGTKILLFEDFIAFCKENGLSPYIELKYNPTDEQLEILMSILNNYGMSRKTTWISFNRLILEHIKNTDNKARLGYLVTKVESSSIDICNSLKTDHNEVFIDSSDYSSTAVSLCKEANIPMEVWVINDTNIIKNLNPYISGVTSDYYHAGKFEYYSDSEYEIVKELTANDLSYKKALNFASPYSYYDSSYRSCYTEFIPLEYGYIYKVEFESTTDSKVAIQYSNDQVFDLVTAKESIKYITGDTGWQNSGVTLGTTRYVAGSKPGAMRINFKDNTSTATENFITKVTISRKRIQ